MKLSTIDKKLISYIHHNYREPLTKIAKNCKLSKAQVDYNIKKYEKQEIIKKFTTYFNLEKLGYKSPIGVFIKLKQNTSETEFYKLIPIKYIQSKGKVKNKFDLYIIFVFKNEIESNHELSKILSNEYIKDYLIVEPYYGKIFPLKIINETTSQDEIYTFNYSKKENIKLDKTDLEIIKILENNGKEKLVNIAKQTNISPELALYKVKNLKKNKIILGYKLIFNYSKLGYNYTGLLINLNNINDNSKKQLDKFCKNNKNITSYALLNNKPNCYIQVIHNSLEELNTIIDNFKKEFKSHEFEIDILLLDEEEYINTLQFL